MEIDHYVVLGLPSGGEGAKLTNADINRAYKTKALELHPDKRPDDPNANINFLKIQSSYEILKDETKRKLHDEDLRKRHVENLSSSNLRVQRQSSQQCGSRSSGKRRMMMADLLERERASYASDPDRLDRFVFEGYDKEMKEKRGKIASMQNSKAANAFSKFKTTAETNAQSAADLDYDKTLKVECLVEYNVQRLKELFGEFGVIEDVVVQSEHKKKYWSALVVMASTDAAVAAVKGVVGDFSYPLLVHPLQKKGQTSVSPANKFRSNLVGAGFQAKENSILEKLLKKAKENESI